MLFLGNYFELFNKFGHPIVRPIGKDEVYVPKTPSVTAVAFSPVEGITAPLPREQNPLDSPRTDLIF